MDSNNREVVDTLTYLCELLEKVVYHLHNRFMNMKQPHHFAFWLMFWLLLVVITFKRQSKFFQQLDQRSVIKNMQAEVMKTLQDEQLVVQSIADNLHGRMANGDPIGKPNKIPELMAMREVVMKMNLQLQDLQNLLNDFE